MYFYSVTYEGCPPYDEELSCLFPFLLVFAVLYMMEGMPLIGSVTAISILYFQLTYGYGRCPLFLITFLFPQLVMLHVYVVWISRHINSIFV